MVCFGGGGGLVAQNPPDWDRTASHYVDCVAYGTYAGPSNARTGAPTQLNGDGHSRSTGTVGQRRRLCVRRSGHTAEQRRRHDRCQLPARVRRRADGDADPAGW
jgi:hypothetical protein